jgi:hypothetical protein
MRKKPTMTMMMMSSKKQSTRNNQQLVMKPSKQQQYYAHFHLDLLLSKALESQRFICSSLPSKAQCKTAVKQNSERTRGNTKNMI